MSFQIIEASRRLIKPSFFPQAMIDEAKVASMVDHLRAGGIFPPVVAAMYDNQALPLDGHHRMSAHERVGSDVDSYTVPGDAFDELCCECRDAEAFVICDGIKSMGVATGWRLADPKKTATLDDIDLPLLIRGFVVRFAKTAGDYDPEYDPPHARFNGPDPVSLLQAASAIERGESTNVWSEHGSGSYFGIADASCRSLHDRIVAAIRDWRPPANLTI
jgi:hypothetical protein